MLYRVALVSAIQQSESPIQSELLKVQVSGLALLLRALTCVPIALRTHSEHSGDHQSLMWSGSAGLGSL